MAGYSFPTGVEDGFQVELGEQRAPALPLLRAGTKQPDPRR